MTTVLYISQLHLHFNFPIYEKDAFNVFFKGLFSSRMLDTLNIFVVTKVALKKL